MKIHIFDFTRTEYFEEDIKYEIPIEIKEQINKLTQDTGIEIGALRIKNSENFIRYYLEQKGYEVHRLASNINKGHNTEGWNLPEQLPKHCLFEVGVPDYICYKNNADWFFVEVKTIDDSLHLNQLRWLFRFEMPPFKMMMVD